MHSCELNSTQSRTLQTKKSKCRRNASFTTPKISIRRWLSLSCNRRAKTKTHHKGRQPRWVIVRKWSCNQRTTRKGLAQRCNVVWPSHRTSILSCPVEWNPSCVTLRYRHKVATTRRTRRGCRQRCMEKGLMVSTQEPLSPQICITLALRPQPQCIRTLASKWWTRHKPMSEIIAARTRWLVWALHWTQTSLCPSTSIVLTLDDSKRRETIRTCNREPQGASRPVAWSCLPSMAILSHDFEL